jgi:hypothetical protein
MQISRTRLFPSATAMVLPSAEYARPRGRWNEAAVPVPSALPLPLPASVVTAPVATSISRTRWLL